MREIYDTDALLKKEYYYKNGNIEQIERYDEQGAKHGKFIFYYENGKVEWEEYYEHGMKQGTFENFYEDGTRKCTTQYKDDKLHGYLFEYDQNGYVVKETRYFRGYEPESS
jgi:uncharacterized protein